MLTITNDHKNFLKDGKPFFYLADTCWSAFTNITDEEWDYYLEKRKTQGFNTLQINILPQWDASATELDWKPFIDDDPMRLNDSYFEHAKEMLLQAKEEGFELALVVMWCNYVPGTWASNMFKKGILPFEFIKPYVKKVHETFSDLDPIYIVSGDTDFPSEQTEKYYIETARELRKLAPNHLFTTHIKGRYSYIPKELEELIDIRFYQSGHNAKDLTMPYSLSEKMQKEYLLVKPLINSEPCYEEMGYSGNQYGRWKQYDVRRAAWVSVLSGASAGVTYGAAGIYSWHKTKKEFGSLLGEGFDRPKTWQEAMSFPGAWDYGFLARIMKGRSITPRQDMLDNSTTDIRVAKDQKGELLIYVPCNTRVRLNLDQDYEFIAIDLKHKNVADLSVEKKELLTCISMHPFSEDALYIGKLSSK